MRLFWTIIAVLALSTAVWWVMRAPEVAPSSAPSDGVGTAAQPAPVISASAPAPIAVPPGQRTSEQGAAVPASMPAGKGVVPKTMVGIETRDAEKLVLPEAASKNAVAPKPADPIKPEPVKSPAPKPDVTPPVVPLKSDVPKADAPKVDPPKVDQPKVDPPKADPPKTETPKADPPKAEGAKPEAAAPLSVKLTPQDDGSTLVDDKYVIKGKGSKDDPYRVTWEMLVSAQDTYQPRLGKKVIPDRLKMISGKWVRISGYIAFPVMSSSPDEMLMMLNQWDGCCIGVPPTPYDAIEVKLKAAAKGNDRLRTSGTLTGQFKVDPFLVKDWLVSLYVMEDGELSDTAGTASPGAHAK